MHVAEERLLDCFRIACGVRSSGLSAGHTLRPIGRREYLRAKSTSEALARDSVDAYFHGVSILRDDMRRELFSNAFKARLRGYDAVSVFQRHAAAGERR